MPSAAFAAELAVQSEICSRSAVQNGHRGRRNFDFRVAPSDIDLVIGWRKGSGPSQVTQISFSPAPFSELDGVPVEAHDVVHRTRARHPLADGQFIWFQFQARCDLRNIARNVSPPHPDSPVRWPSPAEKEKWILDRRCVLGQFGCNRDLPKRTHSTREPRNNPLGRLELLPLITSSSSQLPKRRSFEPFRELVALYGGRSVDYECHIAGEKNERPRGRVSTSRDSSS